MKDVVSAEKISLSYEIHGMQCVNNLIFNFRDAFYISAIIFKSKIFRNTLFNENLNLRSKKKGLTFINTISS